MRPQEEVLRDLELERTRLVEAIEQLKLEAQGAKERLPSRRILAIAGATVLGLVVVRRALRSRRERRLVDRVAEAARDGA